MEEKGNRKMRGIRYLFSGLAAVFVFCILLQVFFAGLAIFAGSEHWVKHTTFIHFFEVLPIVMFILSFFGRIKGWARWLSLGLFLLIMLQYMTAHVVTDTGYLAALHPVIALLMFWGSIVVLRGSFKKEAKI